MRIIIIVSVIFLFVSSCNNEPNKEWYTLDTFKNGAIKKRCYRDSLDTKITFCEVYDSLGNLKSEGEYRNGVTFGMHKFYGTNHKLEWLREYVVVNEKESELNRFYKIGETGDTIKKYSNYFSVNMSKDTLKLGETFRATITLEAPVFDKSTINANLVVPDDSNSIRMLSSAGYKIEYHYTPTHKGEFELRGEILEIRDDFKLYGDSIDKYATRILYINRSYYVR